MDKKLDGIKVAILATDGFEQSELFEPKKALEEAGADVKIVSLEAGEIKGWNEKDWGEKIAVDLTVDEANADDFDALQLPGGVMNPDKLRMNEKAVSFIKAFFEAGKPVGAICHAPWTSDRSRCCQWQKNYFVGIAQNRSRKCGREMG